MKEEEKFDSQIFFARASGARDIWNIQTIYRRGERAHKLPIVSQFNWRNVSEDKFFCQFNTSRKFSAQCEQRSYHCPNSAVSALQCEECAAY